LTSPIKEKPTGFSSLDLYHYDITDDVVFLFILLSSASRQVVSE
jgi:hypothetical protein